MNKHEPPAQIVSSTPLTARLVALTGVPLVERGDDVVQIILAALQSSNEKLRDGDLLVIAQKIVSKAQGRFVRLDTVTASPEAQALAREVRKDPRLVELILRESTEVVRACPDVLIVAHKLGFILANAGIDFSNVEQGEAGDETALLLPENPDLTCAELRSALKVATDADVGVIINDSHGRAFRNGTVGVAIGASGVDALADLRGAPDIFRRRFHSTQVGAADEIAAAASLLMGQADEGRPIVLVRGLPDVQGDGKAVQLVRAKEADLFRGEALNAGALLRGRRSIRHYQPQPVPDEIIEDVLQGAVCAPSAHNRQPWRFALLKDVETRKRLAHAMGERLRTDRLRDGDPFDVIEKDRQRSIERIVRAPIVIIVCMTMEGMDNYPDKRRRACERQMAAQSTAMATQNILLGAQAAGLGASIMCAPLFCPDTVRSSLDLDPTWEPQALVTVGFPAAPGKPFQRRPLADVVRLVRTELLILALAGGVGGAKLASGLAARLPADRLIIVVNTGDDFVHLGLHVSPDLDTVMYWLARCNDARRGWGLAGESWNFMRALDKLGGPTWFRLGDRDLATHMERTRRLSTGESLSRVTVEMSRKLGVAHVIAPMTDSRVQTVVHTNEGPLEFQQYFVRNRCEPQVTRIEFVGAAQAVPSAAFDSALSSDNLEAIVFCPSNPFLSIAPILELPDVRRRIRKHRAPKIAVSPIVAGKAIKGPAAKIFQELGYEPSALEVARLYHDLIDCFVIDSRDAHLKSAIEAIGPRVCVAETIMSKRVEMTRLAQTVIDFAAAVRASTEVH